MGTQCELEGIVFDEQHWLELTHEVKKPLFIIYNQDTRKFGLSLSLPNMPFIGMLPPVPPQNLGGTHFQRNHGVQYSYVGGEMARGIASADLTIALANLGILSFFGSAGLQPTAVTDNIIKIKQAIGLTPFGVNLIHSPDRPGMEEKLAAIYLEHGISHVSASAFMSLSKHVVWYACKGLAQGANGQILRQNHVFAKISHPSVAAQFMSPPPDSILTELVAEGKISTQESILARYLPVAEDITIEADSGGHTDNRPAAPLFARIQVLRDQLTKQFSYSRPIRLGIAGGLGTPTAIAGAYAQGAEYVVIGSVHQTALESGLCTQGKMMLAQADIDDVAMAPAADMFEMGVKVQVLKKGTMMSVRANLLYDLYRRYNCIEDIPLDKLNQLEKNVFRLSIDQVWHETYSYFQQVDPTEVERAKVDAKYKMGLIFRWYIGNSSRWPLVGDVTRQIDYQIWTGPALGAFNVWAKGSFLESPQKREVAQIALNLIEGAAKITRAQQLRAVGFPIPVAAFSVRPQFKNVMHNLDQPRVLR